MASPGLNPVLFFLALDAAKPAGGYAAAQWSNGAGPALGTEHTEIHTGHFGIHLHLQNAGTELDTALTCACVRRGRIPHSDGTRPHKPSGLRAPVCLLAEVNPSPVSRTLSDRQVLDGRKHMDSRTIDSGKRLKGEHSSAAWGRQSAHFLSISSLCVCPPSSSAAMSNLYTVSYKPPSC